jgi:hypothetical protein
VISPSGDMNPTPVRTGDDVASPDFTATTGQVGMAINQGSVTFTSSNLLEPGCPRRK